MNRTCCAIITTTALLFCSSVAQGAPTDDELNVLLDFGSAPGKVGVGAGFSSARPLLLGDPTTISDEPDALRLQASDSPVPFAAGYVVSLAAPPDITAIDADVSQIVVDLTIYEANSYDTLRVHMLSTASGTTGTEPRTESAFEFDLSELAPGPHRLVGGTLADSGDLILNEPLDPQNDPFNTLLLGALNPRTFFDPVLDVAIDQIAFTRIPEPSGVALVVLGVIAASRQRGSGTR